MRFVILLLCFSVSAPAAELTSLERELIQQLGPGTPEPIPLWPGTPLQFLEKAGPEVIATNMVADLKKLGVPARLDFFDEGGHGVGNLIPQRVKNGFPGARWPQLLLEWLDTLSTP